MFTLPSNFPTRHRSLKTQDPFQTGAAVPNILGMGSLYWSDCFVGRRNQFYSIGVFVVGGGLWWWSVLVISSITSSVVVSFGGQWINKTY